MSKFLFFSPHAAIWQHAFPEAIMAEALQKEGHEIIYVSCDGVLNEYCMAMSSIGLIQESTKEQKAAVCTACSHRKKIILDNMKFRQLSIDQELSAGELKEISEISANITEDNYLAFSIDGIDIGRLALYETLLQHKKNSLQFSPLEWGHYKIALRNSLRSFFALRKIITRENPEFFISYNNLYSLNAVGAKVAKSNNCLPYFIHGGLNVGHYFESLLIGQNSILDLLNDLMEQWAELRHMPQPSSSLSYVTDHFLEIFKGRSDRAYSSAKSQDRFDIYKKFSISHHQKILVATMSSYDEAFAAIISGAFPGFDGWLYKNQKEWVQSLIQYFKEKPEYFLIIRVHPREFPNKREAVLSEHAKELKNLFRELPSNVSVNWPTDEISIYDLAEHADVFLNAWSSVGKEMSLLGIPCVVFSKNLFAYPATLNYIGITEPTYFQQIELAIQSGWSLNRILQTYRWYCLEFCEAGVDLSDSYRPTLIYKNQYQKRLVHRLKKLFDPYHMEKTDCRKRSAKLKQASKLLHIFAEKRRSSFFFETHGVANAPTTTEEESAALKKELRRLIQSLYKGDLSIHNTKSLKAKLIGATK